MKNRQIEIAAVNAASDIINKSSCLSLFSMNGDREPK